MTLERFAWVPEAILKEASPLLVPNHPSGRSRNPTDSNYRSLMRPIRKRMMGIAKQLADGDINLAEYERQFSKLIEAGHVGSAKLGRQRAGDLSENVIFDELVGRLAANADRAYLHRFTNDILGGRYTDPLGDLRVGPIQNRMLLYANKARGTANHAFVATSSHQATFDWVMLNAEHCDVCPRYQAGGPYTQLSLPAHPADGTTPCRSNCGCVLVRDDGVIGFSRVFD